MNAISINANTVSWSILRGVTAETVINKANGWAMYDEIVMDLKLKKDINYPADLQLTIGNGLTINGISLIISISYEQTAELRVRNMFADIKLKIGDIVLTPIPFNISIYDTVTKVPS
jgi:hypothetical protein